MAFMPKSPQYLLPASPLIEVATTVPSSADRFNLAEKRAPPMDERGASMPDESPCQLAYGAAPALSARTNRHGAYTAVSNAAFNAGARVEWSDDEPGPDENDPFSAAGHWQRGDARFGASVRGNPLAQRPGGGKAPLAQRGHAAGPPSLEERSHCRPPLAHLNNRGVARISEDDESVGDCSPRESALAMHHSAPIPPCQDMDMFSSSRELPLQPGHPRAGRAGDDLDRVRAGGVERLYDVVGQRHAPRHRRFPDDDGQAGRTVALYGAQREFDADDGGSQFGGSEFGGSQRSGGVRDDGRGWNDRGQRYPESARGRTAEPGWPAAAQPRREREARRRSVAGSYDGDAVADAFSVAAFKLERTRRMQAANAAFDRAQLKKIERQPPGGRRPATARLVRTAGGGQPGTQRARPQTAGAPSAAAWKAQSVADSGHGATGHRAATDKRDVAAPRPPAPHHRTTAALEAAPPAKPRPAAVAVPVTPLAVRTDVNALAGGGLHRAGVPLEPKTGDSTDTQDLVDAVTQYRSPRTVRRGALATWDGKSPRTTPPAFNLPPGRRDAGKGAGTLPVDAPQGGRNVDRGSLDAHHEKRGAAVAGEEAAARSGIVHYTLESPNPVQAKPPLKARERARAALRQAALWRAAEQPPRPVTADARARSLPLAAAALPPAKSRADARGTLRQQAALSRADQSPRPILENPKALSLPFTSTAAPLAMLPSAHHAAAQHPAPSREYDVSAAALRANSAAADDSVPSPYVTSLCLAPTLTRRVTDACTSPLPPAQAAAQPVAASQDASTSPMPLVPAKCEEPAPAPPPEVVAPTAAARRSLTLVDASTSPAIEKLRPTFKPPDAAFNLANSFADACFSPAYDELTDGIAPSPPACTQPADPAAHHVDHTPETAAPPQKSVRSQASSPIKVVRADSQPLERGRPAAPPPLAARAEQRCEGGGEQRLDAAVGSALANWLSSEPTAPVHPAPARLLSAVAVAPGGAEPPVRTQAPQQGRSAHPPPASPRGDAPQLLPAILPEPALAEARPEPRARLELTARPVDASAAPPPPRAADPVVAPREEAPRQRLSGPTVRSAAVPLQHDAGPLRRPPLPKSVPSSPRRGERVRFALPNSLPSSPRGGPTLDVPARATPVKCQPAAGVKPAPQTPQAARFAPRMLSPNQPSTAARSAASMTHVTSRSLSPSRSLLTTAADDDGSESIMASPPPLRRSASTSAADAPEAGSSVARSSSACSLSLGERPDQGIAKASAVPPTPCQKGKPAWSVPENFVSQYGPATPGSAPSGCSHSPNTRTCSPYSRISYSPSRPSSAATHGLLRDRATEGDDSVAAGLTPLAKPQEERRLDGAPQQDPPAPAQGHTLDLQLSPWVLHVPAPAKQAPAEEATPHRPASAAAQPTQQSEVVPEGADAKSKLSPLNGAPIDAHRRPLKAAVAIFEAIDAEKARAAKLHDAAALPQSVAPGSDWQNDVDEDADEGIEGQPAYGAFEAVTPEDRPIGRRIYYEGRNSDHVRPMPRCGCSVM